jgi:hypothetical protein
MTPGGRAGGLLRGRSVPQAPGFALRRPAMAAGPLFSAAPGERQKNYATPERRGFAARSKIAAPPPSSAALRREACGPSPPAAGIAMEGRDGRGFRHLRSIP